MAYKESVFGLITKLCETILDVNNKGDRNDRVKKLRSSAFNILLYKNKPVSDKYWLPNCNDLEIQYLAWQLNLYLTFKQPKLAEDIQSLCKTILDTNWDDLTKKSVLYFLLKMRKSPEKLKENVISRLPESNYRIYTEEDFELGVVANLSNSFSDRSLDEMSSKWSDLFLPDNSLGYFESPFSSTNMVDQNSDEGCSSLVVQPSVWDIVSQMKMIDRRTWETLGNSIVEPEKPFISEAKCNVYAVLEKLQYAEEQKLELKPKIKSNKVLTSKEYMRDLKFVVLGIESTTFKAVGDKFILNPDVWFEGITCSAFKNYSTLMVNCGICYKALQSMIVNVTSANMENYGSIYFEFCNAVRRYLSFYDAATFKFDYGKGLVQLHSYFRKLSGSLFAVASICNEGIYKDERGSSMPRGVELLNYLYKTVFGQSDKHIVQVLLSLLFPCFQIYYIRHLGPWIIKGVVNDPHDEFFIKSSPKYLCHRNRPYWTHGFTIQDELVPNFISDHVKTILECGRSANLIKLCIPKSKIVQYFMANNPPLIQCCLTQGLLQKVEWCIKAYELEMIVAAGGAPFSLNNWLAMKEDEKLIFSKCVAAKRAATIKRIQKRRLEKMAKENKEKQDRYRVLRAEYDQQIALKQEQKIAVLAQELKEEEKLFAIREKAERLIQEEAERMIAHYYEIMQNATDYSEQITNHNDSFKSLHLFDDKEPINNSSSVTLYESQTTDLINANYTQKEELETRALQSVVNNYPKELTEAQKNKQKVMGSSITKEPIITAQSKVGAMTEAQRNKLRVMQDYATTTDMQTNRDYQMTSKITFNHNDVINKNIATLMEKTETNDNEDNKCTPNQRKDKEGNVISTNVDSTNSTPKRPSNENPSRLSLFRQERNFQLEVPNTSPEFEILKSDSMFTATATASAGCSFSCTPVYEKSNGLSNSYQDCPMRLSIKDASEIQVALMGNYIKRSLVLPLQVQTSLVRAELLKLFIVDLKYLTHLEDLRNYYFLLDGEYCRSVTRDLFRNLYLQDNASYGFKSLARSLASCLENHHKVRFCFKLLPKMVDLGDINALDAIALSYDVHWPLNILLPTSTMVKYDEIFKFLLKVHRVAWVLQNIFMDLKMLNKEHSRHAALLSFSPHYRRMQLCRHIMTHFIQTFQNYIVGEVLQTGWVTFQEALKTIENIDDLYTAHVTYVKQIYFLCLLNKRADVVKKVIMKIFKVILKFYDYMRSRDWILNETEFEHPNYNNLEEIFANFIELSKCFFKLGRKIARAAYQQQFAQLIDLLDINGYYSSCFPISD